MAARAKAVIVCDDARFEIGNKISAIGIYNEAIAGAGEIQGPLALPKLAIVFVVAGLRGSTEVRFRFLLRYPGWPRYPDPDFASISRPRPDDDQHNFVHMLMPAVFPIPGSLEITLEIKVGAETYPLDHQLRVTWQAASASGGRAN